MNSNKFVTLCTLITRLIGYHLLLMHLYKIYNRTIIYITFTFSSIYSHKTAGWLLFFYSSFNGLGDKNLIHHSCNRLKVFLTTILTSQQLTSIQVDCDLVCKHLIALSFFHLSWSSHSEMEHPPPYNAHSQQ